MRKSEKGITLLSLSIFVIGITIIIGIVTVISNFFYQNIIKMEDSSSSAAEFSKFNLSFIEEVKKKGNEINTIDEPDGKYISFTSGNTYLFQDGKIYKNKAVLVRDVIDCSFYEESYESKKIIKVYLELGNPETNTFAKRMEYVMNNDE